MLGMVKKGLGLIFLQDLSAVHEEHPAAHLTGKAHLIGDHHLQMIKAALPFLEVPEQKAVSVFVKAQELKNTLELLAEILGTIFHYCLQNAK